MAKNLDRWLHSWIFRRRSSLPPERHVFIAVCDHFEPFHGAQKSVALDRIRRWQREWRKIANEFRDSDGIAPRHTFFYPIEQWDPDVCGGIADLCRDTGSEMEVHLHHDGDTSEKLARALHEGITRLVQIGQLAKDPAGRAAFGFVHGNWALDHSHPNGRGCGVPDELSVLRDAGCYADFTLPSAPSRCQVPTINAIYYAKEDGEPRSHAHGIHARVGESRRERAGELLLVTGPLGLNWRRRKAGILPRIENSELSAANPPTPDRLRLWEKCNIHVEGRPDWLFIKLHTHGGVDSNANILLGDPMRAFHRHLRDRASANSGFQYHYVSAREMVNLVHAAESGQTAEPGRLRDFVFQRSDGTAHITPLPKVEAATGHKYWPAI